MSNLILDDWVLSEDFPQGGAPPMSTPGGPGDPMGQGPESGMPGPPGMPGQPPQGGDQGDGQDVTQDPEQPDMPDGVSDQEDDFEVWKNKYHKESIKGNITILLQLLNAVRDRDLDPVDRKFVEDNLQVQYLRSQANVLEASKKVRKGINEELDRNNPATSVVNHLNEALQEQPMLSQVFIKTAGYYGMKGEINRKFIAALTGAVQVSSGSDKEDIVVWDNDYSIMISTRMNARFGDINIGHWSLKKDDPHHFLTEPERDKLETGSPQEREALRHRVVLESIFNRFRTRAFLVTIVGTDGTVYLIGWDLSTSLKAAYLDGRIVVRTKVSENSEVMLDEKGNITAYQDVDILYSKDTGQVNSDGKPVSKEVRFMERREGVLFLVAPLDVIKEATTTMPGLVMAELPFTGNPSDLKGLSRATYTVDQLLARQP